ncbi:acyl-CoA/acyl-ACP dehydrogenase [Rhodococcus sp. D2-41]|uniref:Acyl-CoA/acyl-ACP dehydrogenase n=1 Tax=Speluncibacter jeojiensis TaxID=2710754 RepID=A0A9X4M641_9ACTN|nr:acyl-CoA dehydrogenase family protein [Rhodococcus sp. D2-41]MDG3011508.1 acyl-CoA/acyl-ACP dehydrogenase [Rhodococcus sp. D2-41]MDG3015136.1 acyl-CoA/acyl-ACP dehydrogenase [Corynebacteriales bacterium D3-21]
MDFTLTEAQQDLAQLTRSISEKLCTTERLTELDGVEDRFDRPQWQALAAADVLSAALPESVGGGGLGILEQCSILRELGRTLAPVPYLASIVMAADALAEFGDEPQREWAAKAATGAAVLTVALDEEPGGDPSAPVTTAEKTSDGWVLTGFKTTVAAAPIADLILVPATTPDGVTVFLVQPGDAGVHIERQISVDYSSEGSVELTGVHLGADRILGDAGAGKAIVDRIVARGTVGLSAQQLGTLERSLELVSAYAREREQFDRPIGSFQAVAQRLADAFIDIKGVRLSMWQAAWSLSEGLPGDEEIRTAKFWAADAGHRVAHTVIHVHGGVGLDRDHPVHRYFLAAKHAEFALGSASEQLRRLGAHLAAVPA